VCLWFIAVASNAQADSRVANFSPIRRGDGRIMNEIDPSQNRIDTNSTRRPNSTFTTAVGGNPHSIMFSNLRVQNDPNSMQLDWTTQQQQLEADYFEVQQTVDSGLHWTSIGVVPANRTQTGEVPYHFSYNKSIPDVQLRIVAVTLGGNRINSSVLQSPFNNESTMMVTPNPVRSTATIRIGSSATGTVKIMVVNNSGIVVQTRETSVMQGMNPFPLDMSALPPGYYTVCVLWQGGKGNSMKILKQ
jgi:hypothetical protein